MARAKSFVTASGLPVRKSYLPGDLEKAGVDYAGDIGDPGAFPYVRGIDADMYRKDLWIMGQLGGFGTPEDANRRLKYLIEQGVTGFSVAIDLPTQLGYDSDHPMARGEVGKCGGAINSLADMETVFDGIPLDSVRQIRVNANAIGPFFTALFLALAEKQGISPKKVAILLQNDILKDFISRGAYIYPPKPSVALCTDVIEFCARNDLPWIPINFCGYHMREGGCTAVQEIAFTFANGIAYMESALARGVTVDQFAPRLTCMFSSATDFIEEIAKFRAARKVWAKLLRDRFGALDPESMKLKIFCFTGGSTLTRQQPLNNIVRITLEAMAGVLGGVQILHTAAYDEAYGTPSREAATLSLRIQQIIAHESGVTNTVDPLGGSFYLEELTHQIESQIWKIIGEVDALGGAVMAIERGYFQGRIEEAAYREQRDIESGKKVLVGLNKFQSDDVKDIETFKVDDSTDRKQIERLTALRERRDSAQVQATLHALKQAAILGENVIPTTLAAVKAYATVGEICDVLRSVHGEHVGH